LPRQNQNSPPSPPRPSRPAAKNPYLFVPGLGKSVVRSSLQAFDADTGILVWKIDDLPGINEISADDSSLYVAAQDHIQAYDLDDGSASWESETIPSKRIYAMEAENSALLVYSVEASFGYEEQVVRLIDPMNGAIDERLRIEVSSGRKLLCEDKEREFWLDTNRLLAYRKSDDDVLWQVTIEDPVNCIPVGPMGLAVLSERGWSTIHLINRISGEIEWISSQIIISNIAYSEGTIYAIQEDGSLIGVDFNTGKEIGKIMLALPRNVGDTMSETYQVSMYKSKLFAYWGDSQDLIAFDILKK